MVKVVYTGVEFPADFSLEAFGDADEFLTFLDYNFDLGGDNVSDAFAAAFYDYDWAVAFGGENFVIDSSNIPQSGTITALIEADISGDEPAIMGYIYGLDIDIADLISAVLSPSTDDDEAILESVFAGNDNVRLMYGDNLFYGAGGNDKITSGGGDDFLIGGQGNDKIKSGNGDDVLWGDGGKDKLYGGNGADVFYSGAGKDLMVAGNDQDEDVFVFWETRDSANNRKADKIKQFDSGEDKLDFTWMDGDSTTDDFETLSISETGAAANSVWWSNQGKHATVYVDVDGDAVSDMQVIVMKTNLDVDDFGPGSSDWLLA